MAVYQTPFGNIRRDDGCRDDYARLHVYDPPPVGIGAIILQAAALRSFQRAEEAYGRRLWRPEWPGKLRMAVDDTLWKGEFVRDRDIRNFRPIILTGSIRSCETAKRLYFSAENQARIAAGDGSRYARPESTLHPHGLAIDVDTRFLNSTIHDLLFKFGWRQSRPKDEPWHFSYTGTWMPAA